MNHYQLNLDQLTAVRVKMEPTSESEDDENAEKCGARDPPS